MKTNKELAEIIRKYEAAQAKTKANGGILPCPNGVQPEDHISNKGKIDWEKVMTKPLPESIRKQPKANGGVLPCPNACGPTGEDEVEQRYRKVHEETVPTNPLPKIIFDGTATEVIMKALGAIGNKEIFLGVAALLAEDNGSPSDIVQHLVALEVCRKALQKKTGIKWGLAIEQDKVTLTNI